MLPSEYTSQASLDDAQLQAENLGCRYDYVPISAGRAAITDTLAPLFAGHAAGFDRRKHSIALAWFIVDGIVQQVW
jgi:NH3-dependent NAD+ synthetase